MVVMNTRVILVLATLLHSIQCFAPNTPTTRGTAAINSKTSLNGIFDKVGEMFEELDNFIDDATARRLGAGSNFYGKRKSSFYGKKDKGRKRDPGMADPTEDFQGPASGGLYKWIQNDDGKMVPVSRRRETPLERNPGFWDKFYEKQAKKGTSDE